MCGRYYMDDDTIREIERWLERLDCEISEELLAQVPRGEVCPSCSALAITGRKKRLLPELMDWGFPKYEGKGLIINARAESVKEKRIFQDGIRHRRCVLPARHYYEWDAGKEKVTFSGTRDTVLYMAGFYRKYQNRDCFVILTTNANASVQAVHDRMPLILRPDEVEKWIFEDELLDYFLKMTPELLNHSKAYEQICLPL